MQETTLEISAELQQALELLRRAYRLPSATAVLELLVSMQIERSVYQMTGLKSGPRLAVDNTETQEKEQP